MQAIASAVEVADHSQVHARRTTMLSLTLTSIFLKSWGVPPSTIARLVTVVSSSSFPSAAVLPPIEVRGVRFMELSSPAPPPARSGGGDLQRDDETRDPVLPDDAYGEAEEDRPQFGEEQPTRFEHAAPA
jgi:hypothetical protein